MRAWKDPAAEIMAEEQGDSCENYQDSEGGFGRRKSPGPSQRRGLESHREPHSNLRSASLLAESPGQTLADLTGLLDGAGCCGYETAGTRELSEHTSRVPTGLETPEAHGSSRLLRYMCRTHALPQTGPLLGIPREIWSTLDCYMKAGGTWPINARVGQSPSGALSPPSDPADRAGHVPRTRRRNNLEHTLRILSPLAAPGTLSPFYPPLQTVRCPPLSRRTAQAPSRLPSLLLRASSKRVCQPSVHRAIQLKQHLSRPSAAGA